ncbi:fimbrial protein [Serratia sp. AKBS12]|uniref:fimbrial protein n=1 Tax=Serratia sp. AKBS12 TaxID=2974597 RepID=UPI0021653709|nr:fimbrial protein [Serratia sp. AKBS12]MCS3408355.1 type 1 fimbrial protein [Serratia sp. AKBS12]HEI8864693.1 type 1 fimbrial protein [Serratia odorifera]
MRYNPQVANMMGLLLLGGALYVPQLARSGEPKEIAQPRLEMFETARVHFVGELLSTPCSLAVDSQEQLVDLGAISAKQFRNQGDRSQSVDFTLRFQDCLMGAHEYRAGVDPARYSGNAAYVNGEQTVALSFIGVPDDYRSDLLKLNGTRGVGLRLQDARGAAVPLNQQVPAAFLQPGDNQLHFSASLESTQKFVQADYVDAIVNVNVYYF